MSFSTRLAQRIAPQAPSPRFTAFAWFVVAVILVVIVWGALVRATGSGAGCGSHWPLCNGEIVPPAPALATFIEFTHRLTSGISLLLVVALYWMARQRFAAASPVRRAALASLVLIIVEALIGAGLVIFGLVEDNASAARAVYLALHLVNTLLLLAAVTLTADLSSRRDAQFPLSAASTGLWVVILLVIASGASGAVAALGDTLYPAESLREGIADELSATAPTLLRLRVIHPLIAVAASLAMLSFVRSYLERARPRQLRRGAVAPSAEGSRRARWLMVLVFAQLIGGVVNVVLLAPTWMQLVHLLMADLVWIALMLFTATWLVESRQPLQPARPSARDRRPAPTRAT
ncbi:MAG: COX15/CtaA family protein [Acidobacteriota bacterium]